jgi:hypothetical protein
MLRSKACPPAPASGVRREKAALFLFPAHPPELQTLKSRSFDKIVDVCAYSTAALLRKEVIQPQVPLRLPCYDFTPVMNHTVVSVPLAVKLPTSGTTHSHGVTGGVYKARERIHRGVLIRDY